MMNHRVLVIGAGISGLTAARTLALFGIGVDLVERRTALGGHAAELACMATDRCVKCGACLVQEALAAVASDPRITIHAGSRLGDFRRGSQGFEFTIDRAEATGSGGSPPVAGAAHAVVLAAGFDVFDPQAKAYGHGIFPNVVTLLELERGLRARGRVLRPSDGAAPRRVAFIQCVGSRDARIGHLWCSRFCCAAALRAARRIKALRPETEITVFYIDIQSFGRDFEPFYGRCRQELRLVRAVPGEAFELGDRGVRLNYTEGPLHPVAEDVFDLVVLSTGLQPPEGLDGLAERLGLAPTDGGFASGAAVEGVFTAGAVRGPMGIADSAADARDAAARVLAFLGRSRGRPGAPATPLAPACRQRAFPQGA